MKALVGATRKQANGARRRLIAWSLGVLAGEMAGHPLQAPRIVKRFRRTYRTANLMRDWTKIMRFGSDGDLCHKMSVYVPHWPSRALEGRLKRALRNDYVPPEQVTLSITDACPYRCRHCSNVRGPSQAMPLGRLTDLVREIQDIGGSWLNIGGGEPALEFERALAVARTAGDRSETWLNTTGFDLDTDKIKRLQDAGLFGGRLSVHSSDPAEHDEFVGYQGAFHIAADAIRLFREQDMFVILSAAIPEVSMDEETVRKFMELGRDLGAGFVELIPIRPAGRAVVQCSHAELKCHHVCGEIFRKFNNDPALLDCPGINSPAYLETPDRFGCVAAAERLYLSASGDVQPCPLVNLAVGNVMDEPLKAIWDRMHSFLPAPRTKRLCSELGPVLERHLDQSGRDLAVLPIRPQESTVILRELPPCDTPKVWAL